MAAKGITLYSVGCQPAIGNTMYTIGFMRALAQRCNGRYVPLQDATLLSNVIIGGCREELSLYRSALKILDSSNAVSGDFELASKNLMQEGCKVTALKFSDPDVEAFAIEVSKLVQAKTLPEALASLKQSKRSPIPSNNKAGVTIAGNSTNNSMLKLLENVNITPEQVEHVCKKYGPKYKELASAASSLVAARQRRQEAVSQEDAAAEFYRRVAIAAKYSSITVSVLTMEGEDCNLENVGMVSDLTNGHVDVVNPVHLQEKAEEFLSQRSKGTNVKLSLFFSDLITPVAEPSDVLATHSITRDIGVATDNTDISLSFEINPEAIKSLTGVPELPPHLKDVPLQLQLEWTDPTNGSLLMRTISWRRPTSNDRILCETNIDSAAVGIRAIQFAASLAQKGQYTEARIHLVSTLRLLQRSIKTEQHSKDYLAYVVQAEKLDGFMREAFAAQQALGSADQGKTRDDDASKVFFVKTTCGLSVLGHVSDEISNTASISKPQISYAQLESNLIFWFSFPKVVVFLVALSPVGV